MYTFIFKYSSNKELTFEHIKTVKYIQFDTVTISGEEMSSHLFPLGITLHLYSDDSNYTVDAAGLQSIQVKKEI